MIPLNIILTLQYVKTDMSPQGTLGVEEVATGIVKVTLDSKTESGEFYQVSPLPIISDIM